MVLSVPFCWCVYMYIKGHLFHGSFPRTSGLDRAQVPVGIKIISFFSLPWATMSKNSLHLSLHVAKGPLIIQNSIGWASTWGLETFVFHPLERRECSFLVKDVG